ncbi:hypothetical protein V1477_019066, partial [Vespula maculifrons]
RIVSHEENFRKNNKDFTNEIVSRYSADCIIPHQKQFLCFLNKKSYKARTVSFVDESCPAFIIFDTSFTIDCGEFHI